MRIYRKLALSAGFTLVELVLVIVVVGIVAAAAGRFITQPVQGYLDLQRRAALTDTAQTALARMSRELRLALPNSVRVSASGRALELLRIRTAGRYRAQAPGDVLDFTAASDAFDVIGALVDAGAVRAAPGATLADCVGGAVDCLAIYNTGQPGANAYALDTLAAIQTVTASSVSFARTSPFALASPSQRFYVVETPVSYVCDPATGTIRRFQGYPISAAHATVDSAAELIGAGASSALLVDRVSACSFSYQPGTASRGGLATLRVSLSVDGERVSLLQQAHVDNVP